MNTARTTLLTLFLALIGFAMTQSGGGFGGGAPSSPPSGGGGDFGGGYGGGLGGGYGGFGYVPFGYGGAGGGSLLGVLIVFGVMFFILQYMRRSLSVGSSPAGGTHGSQGLKVQLLLSEGDEVKRALQDVARRGDPDTNEGLARMLTEAALVALRHPERWTYGHVERTSGAGPRVDAQVGSWATEARAAFTVQTTSHYQNQSSSSAFEQRSDYRYQRGGLYLALTIAVAAWELAPTADTGNNAGAVRAALLALAGIQAHQLIRAEVVWSPDAEGEFLSEDEAIMKYPNLTKI
ncbi:DUF1517 domain-containing protein [Deinococcus peraridilitoris]|uniref:Putative membrane protein n=1 Tax=Deinococcus peraridilitoris (strain DSM 19664 / LMG 22246 / CIP 109416 / KR-200) TaxID=937777 RepID=L0A678_DEIPD|nr:DUF1517 domain-containing protein [Deinococcus peraridilitoris]AFZ68662.1 putative membrane protein [Deinococcus peraridilitoris DSM 19664]